MRIESTSIHSCDSFKIQWQATDLYLEGKTGFASVLAVSQGLTSASTDDSNGLNRPGECLREPAAPNTSRRETTGGTKEVDLRTVFLNLFFSINLSCNSFEKTCCWMMVETMLLIVWWIAWQKVGSYGSLYQSLWGRVHFLCSAELITWVEHASAGCPVQACLVRSAHVTGALSQQRSEKGNWCTQQRSEKDRKGTFNWCGWWFLTAAQGMKFSALILQPLIQAHAWLLGWCEAKMPTYSKGWRDSILSSWCSWFGSTYSAQIAATKHLHCSFFSPITHLSRRFSPTKAKCSRHLYRLLGHFGVKLVEAEPFS